MRIKITPQELKLFCKYVYDLTGIVLDDSKAYLLEGRLNPILKKRELSNYMDLYRAAQADRSNKLRDTIVDAMVTNETYFFRDSSPFLLLQEHIMPELLASKQAGYSRDISIWSAASSRGQELYSIGIALKELGVNGKGYQVRLLGTDISKTALKYAEKAAYTKFELSRGMDFKRLTTHFKKVENTYEIDPSIRKWAQFKYANLHEPLTRFGAHDIIFCRNVAVYFNTADRKVLFDRLAKQLKPPGYLIIGSTESLVGINDRFQRTETNRGAYYRLHT